MPACLLHCWLLLVPPPLPHLQLLPWRLSQHPPALRLHRWNRSAPRCAAIAIATARSWSLALVITAVLPLMVFAQVVQASQTFGGHAEVTQPCCPTAWPACPPARPPACMLALLLLDCMSGGPVRVCTHPSCQLLPALHR